MSAYKDAAKWAEERGGSGALNMQKFLMSLYNPEFWAFSVGQAIGTLDQGGKKLLMACLSEYADVENDTDELVSVCSEIRKRIEIAEWEAVLLAGHKAQNALRK